MKRYVVYSSFGEVWVLHSLEDDEDSAKIAVVKRHILDNAPGGYFSIKVSDRWKKSSKYSSSPDSRLFVREHLPKILSRFPCLPEKATPLSELNLSMDATSLAYMSAQFSMESETAERLKAIYTGSKKKLLPAEAYVKVKASYFGSSSGRWSASLFRAAMTPSFFSKTGLTAHNLPRASEKLAAFGVEISPPSPTGLWTNEYSGMGKIAGSEARTDGEHHDECVRDSGSEATLPKVVR